MKPLTLRKKVMRRVKKAAVRRYENAKQNSAVISAALASRQNAGPLVPDDDLPVVARMVIEIRSDGTRTIARGALEDTVGGEHVSIDARGSSPVELAATLAKTIFSIPKIARQAALDRQSGVAPPEAVATAIPHKSSIDVPED
ncbi:MAG: hypothetical protein HRU17_10350 [Polyangiaceae bacterium]|nr:hypothetical protein [Polyangiaceae bacterium]